MAAASPLLDSLVNAPLPERLFHYTSVEGLEGIAKSKAIWASAAQYLNDSKEFRLAIELARNHLHGAAVQAGESPVSRLIRYLHDQLERIENFLVCVFSLSQQGDLLSQWRGYCPAGGYAIGFSPADLRRLLAAQGCRLARCVYDEPTQRKLVAEALVPTLAALPSSVPADDEAVKKLAEPWIPALFERLSRVAPIVKHAGFAEEQEWRVIWIPPGSGQRFEYRISRNMFVPYIPLTLLNERGKMVIDEIIIGPMQHQYIAANALSGFLNRNAVPWKGIRHSTTPYRAG